MEGQNNSRPHLQQLHYTPQGIKGQSPPPPNGTFDSLLCQTQEQFVAELEAQYSQKSAGQGHVAASHVLSTKLSTSSLIKSPKLKKPATPKKSPKANLKQNDDEVMILNTPFANSNKFNPKMVDAQQMLVANNFRDVSFLQKNRQPSGSQGHVATGYIQSPKLSIASPKKSPTPKKSATSKNSPKTSLKRQVDDTDEVMIVDTVNYNKFIKMGATQQMIHPLQQIRQPNRMNRVQGQRPLFIPLTAADYYKMASLSVQNEQIRNTRQFQIRNNQINYGMFKGSATPNITISNPGRNRMAYVARIPKIPPPPLILKAGPKSMLTADHDWSLLSPILVRELEELSEGHNLPLALVPFRRTEFRSPQYKLTFEISEARASFQSNFVLNVNSEYPADLPAVEFLSLKFGSINNGEISNLRKNIGCLPQWKYNVKEIVMAWIRVCQPKLANLGFNYKCN